MTDPRADQLALNLSAQRERLAAACAAAGRSVSEVTIIAVTKTYPAGNIAMRPVIYEGRLSNDGRIIAGSWDTGTLHGPFQMERL